jgi:hypothetical protein
MFEEKAWRIVDPVLQAGTQVFKCESKARGPQEVERLAPPGRRQHPVVTK